jgi:hypothetical protein
MQQHHQQFAMIASFSLLFMPSSDHASFRVKEKPHNLLNVEMGKDLVPLM